MWWGWGTKKRKLRLPRMAGPEVSRSAPGLGGFAQMPGCSRRPGLRPESSRQVPPASRFSSSKVSGPWRAKVGSGIRAGGPGDGGWGVVAAAWTLLPGPGAASGPGDRPVSLATRLCWSSPRLCARGGCPPHPPWVLWSGHSWSFAVSPASALFASVCFCHK